jgi:hypothetical protein
MIAMAVHDDWVSVAKAAEIADCSEQFIRRLLLKHLPRDAKGKPSSDRTRGCPLDGWLVNGRAWTVSRASPGREAEAGDHTSDQEAEIPLIPERNGAPKKSSQVLLTVVAILLLSSSSGN